MKSLHTFAALVLTGSLAVAADPAPPPTAETPADFVRLLGDKSFQVRDRAAQQLKKLGVQAKPALLEGAKSADAEVANRCVRLLAEIAGPDLEKRVQAFLADKERKQKHDVPMLERFRKIAGDDDTSREMYRDLLKTNAAFLEECAADANTARKRYDGRLLELYNRLFTPTGEQLQGEIKTIDLAAIFLVGADENLEKDGPIDFKFMTRLLWQPALKDYGRDSPPLRRLFCNWADKQTDATVQQQSLEMIYQVYMAEGVGFVIKMMKKNPAIPVRARAVAFIGRYGGGDRLPTLEALFSDSRDIDTVEWQKVKINTRIGDFALAMAVHLSGQQLKDYGFAAISATPGFLWATNSPGSCCGFSSEEKRAAAFAKYKAWKAQKKETMP